MTEHFETLPNTAYDYAPGIPIHPQPGIFETTVATIPLRWRGDPEIMDAMAGCGFVTHVEVEEILSQPAWTIEDFKAKVMAKYGPMEGWARTGKAQKDHYFPIPPPVVDRLSLCETHVAPRDTLLRDDQTDPGDRCANCTRRLEILRVNRGDWR